MQSEEIEPLIPSSEGDGSKSTSKSSAFLVPNSRLTLTWKKLTYTVETGSKPIEILKSVSGFANPGEILAVLGESGSGKTSLISILSGRMATQRNVTISGSIKINSLSIQEVDYSLYSSYLPQENIYFSYLTPREALMFAGSLKLNLSKPKLKKRVEKLLKLFKIENVADTIIGDTLYRGLSGGEKKRLCIAAELISSPAIILMDEPVSGLDSYTAEIVINLLRELANKGRVVIISIHQPGDLLYAKFDRLILMQEGRFVYQGTRLTCPKYFEDMGLECPKSYNPAEFFVKCMHVADRKRYSEKELKMMEMFDKKYNASYEAGLVDMKRDGEERVNARLMRYQAGFYKQLLELTRRGFRAFVRNPLALMFKVANTVVFGTLVALLFLNLQTNSKGIMNRAGLLQCGVFNSLFFPIFVGSFLLPIERDIMHKEYRDNMYGISPYVISKMIVELPMNIFFAIGINAICYYSTGLNTSEPYKFYYAILILLIAQINGVTIGLISGAISSSVKMASFIGPTFSVPLIMWSGFFSLVESIPDITEWVKYLSPYYYGYQAMLNNEFDGLDVDDDVYPGPYERFGIKRDIGTYMWMFAINITVTFILGFILLKIRAEQSKYSIG